MLSFRTTTTSPPSFILLCGKPKNGTGMSSRTPAILMSPHVLWPLAVGTRVHTYAMCFMPSRRRPTTMCCSSTMEAVGGTGERHCVSSAGFCSTPMLVRHAADASRTAIEGDEPTNFSGSSVLTRRPSPSWVRSVSRNRSVGSRPTTAPDRWAPSRVQERLDLKKSCSVGKNVFKVQCIIYKQPVRREISRLDWVMTHVHQPVHARGHSPQTRHFL